MQVSAFIQEIVPQYVPQKMNGKLNIKVVQKKDYKRSDGTCALYIQIFLNKKRLRIPLKMSVEPKQFNSKLQRIRKNHSGYNDLNLIIEKKLSYINDIEVRYRLSEQQLTLKALKEEIDNPTYRIDFNKFSLASLSLEKGKLKKDTYRQQESVLNKIKAYQEVIYFNDLTVDWLDGYITHCAKKLNNSKTTINSNLKTIKKFINKANDRGIRTPIKSKDIKVGSMNGDRTFLDPIELKTIIKYYNNEFIPLSRKHILKQFLFSCFTGLRLGDIEQIGPQNFIADYLAITAQKTGKFQRIRLNERAREFMPGENGWDEKYTREYVNRELKQVARVCQIKKHISYHVSRHTFATLFLMAGGKVEHLQSLMGHSNIRETMIYVHIVQSVTDEQILLMDDLI